jgi:hypothetical protein
MPLKLKSPIRTAVKNFRNFIMAVLISPSQAGVYSATEKRFRLYFTILKVIKKQYFFKKAEYT